VVASNKALTNLIGASSASEYGPMYGANLVLPKQRMVAALANALRAGRHGNLAGRAKIETEFESMLEAGNYEGLGWSGICRTYVVAPPEFALWHEAEPVTLDQLRASMIHWLADEHPA
jgi:hypothetical protein